MNTQIKLNSLTVPLKIVPFSNVTEPGWIINETVSLLPNDITNPSDVSKLLGVGFSDTVMSRLA